MVLEFTLWGESERRFRSSDVGTQKKRKYKVNGWSALKRETSELKSESATEYQEWDESTLAHNMYVQLPDPVLRWTGSVNSVFFLLRLKLIYKIIRLSWPTGSVSN